MKEQLSNKLVILPHNCNLELESVNLSAISILLTAKFEEELSLADTPRIRAAILQSE